MYSSSDKTTKTSPAVHQTAGTTFFRKAGEESFFGAKETPSFFKPAVQAKLTVSTPEDPQEKEADAVAEKVMRMPEPVTAAPLSENEEKLQPKEEEQIQEKQEAPLADKIQCKEEPDRLKLQAKLQTCNCGAKEDTHIHAKADTAIRTANTGDQISLYSSDVMRQSGRGPPTASHPFEQTLASSKGSGSALPGDTQQFMESRFNADFSSVRIHSDSTAASLSRTVNAQAFAHGNDIYFNSGKFSPNSTVGRTLLAHELTHTVQQGASKTFEPGQNGNRAVAPKKILPKHNQRVNTLTASGSKFIGSGYSKEPGILKKEAVPDLETGLANAKRAQEQPSLAAKPALSTWSVQANGNLHSPVNISLNKAGPGKDLLNKEERNEDIVEPADQLFHNIQELPSPLNLVKGRSPPVQRSTERLSCKKEIQCPTGDSFDYSSTLISTDSKAGAPLLQPLPAQGQQTIATIQRDPEPPAEAAPEEESLFDKLKNGFDTVLKLVLPDAVYNLYVKIKNGGILNLIKDTLIDLVKGLFNKAGFSNTEIQALFEIFTTLQAQLPAILKGLLTGDCKPLFAALNVLSEVVSTIAGRVWDNLMAELEPLRLWLIEIWETFGAPVIEEITAFAGEQWNQLKALGTFIWDSFRPIREEGEEAWNWVVDKLGFGSSDEPGILGYISGKMSEAWDSIKSELQPVIAPINDVIEGIKALASLDVIRNLQEEAKQWLDEVVKTATAMGSDEDAVANKQVTLRQVLLPTLNKSIDRLKAVLQSAGDWVVEKVGLVTNSVSGFISGIQGNTHLSAVYPLIQWVPATINSLNDWATNKVTGLFNMLQSGVEYLKAFVEPVLQLLEKLVSVAGNLLKYLPDLILGVPYMLLPRCIKDPIIKWLTEVVLKQIPIISEFIALTEKWEEIKTVALTVLKQVFLDGQLAKGLWTYFKTLLNILGIDPQLVTKVVAKAAQNFSEIISKPGAFLKNIWTAIRGGFSQFFANIWIHLPKGALDWLFGEVKGATQVAPPKDFSIGSIFGFVLELFGITKENVYARMSENPRIGPKKVEQIRKMERVLTGALEWITVWIREGPEGLLKKIKKEIGDLKTMVIQAIVSWISTSIVAEITKKLLTSADPLGIGATLNTIKLIYDTLKTAVAYINRMLNLVNSVMDSVADIISGNTKGASLYLEGVLAKAVPFVVGFAVEVIIGPIGEKIKEIVGGVRKKIDAGIDFLINGALDFIGTLVETGKQAVGAVLDWAKGLLGLQQPFTTADGVGHRIFFIRQGNTVKLMLNPSPEGDYVVKINEVNALPTMMANVPGAINVPLKRNGSVISTISVPGGSVSMAALKVHALQVASHLNGLIDSNMRTSTDPSTQVKDQTPDFSASLLGLSSITSHLLSSEAGGPLPVTPLPDYGGLTNGFGKRMDVKPLTKLGVPGTPPSVTSPIWADLLLRKEKPAGDSYYIAGHLLNHNIHGSGSTWENLTPITRKANAQHVTSVESKVKEAVDKGLILHYTVDVNYSMARKNNLIDEIEKVPGWNTNSVLNEKHRIIEAEAALPTHLTCSLKQIKVDGTDLPAGDPSFDAKYKFSGVKVDNAPYVAQDSLTVYYLASAAAVTYKDFKTLSTEAIMALATNPGLTWEAFYNNPANKVSIDNPSIDKEALQDIFRKKEVIDEERKRIDSLMDIQNWLTFANGRKAYTGTLLSSADKSDLQQRYHARMLVLKGFFFQTLTSYVNTRMVDPDTVWGPFRNVQKLFPKSYEDLFGTTHIIVSESEIQHFKTTVFDVKIKQLKTSTHPIPASP